MNHYYIVYQKCDREIICGINRYLNFSKTGASKLFLPASMADDHRSGHPSSVVGLQILFTFQTFYRIKPCYFKSLVTDSKKCNQQNYQTAIKKYRWLYFYFESKVLQP